ncbi:MAG: hypothetical protein J0M02_17195, partial [Planctomycetes bacterium]|nr:hypothetical protein [Planctomycetota bacterium]
AGKRMDDALALVVAAQDFAPDDAGAWLLAGQLQAATGKRAEAVVSLDKAQELRKDALAAELRRLCAEAPADADLQIADVLVRMGVGSFAGGLKLAAEQQAELVRRQLQVAWPKMPARCLRVGADGTLALSLRRYDLVVDGVEPLRGMPLAALDIGLQDKIRDLTPLATLPLTQLVLTGVGASDFSPILGLRLKSLAIADTGFSSIAALRGMPLESLSMSIPGIVSLSPLANMPIKELRLQACDALKDIGALGLKAIEKLSLEASAQGAAALTDLGPLRGRPISELSLARQRGIADLSPLKGLPLMSLDVSGTAVRDLSPVLGPALRQLNLVDSAVDDLRQLAGSRLESLAVSPQRIRQGLPELTRIASLRSVNGMATEDFLRWVELQRAIVAANPSYPWNATAVYDDGKPVELRFSGGIKSLAPLKGLPLRILVVQSSPVADLSPLEGMPLTALDISGTEVAKIAVLATTPSLTRLYMGRLRIADVRPLAKLSLEEIAFSPGAVQQGMELLRGMSSLKQAGTSPFKMMPIGQFWSGIDRGDIK